MIGQYLSNTNENESATVSIFQIFLELNKALDKSNEYRKAKSSCEEDVFVFDLDTCYHRSQHS